MAKKAFLAVPSSDRTRSKILSVLILSWSSEPAAEACCEGPPPDAYDAFAFDLNIAGPVSEGPTDGTVVRAYCAGSLTRTATPGQHKYKDEYCD